MIEQWIKHIYEREPGFEMKRGMTVVDCGAHCGEYTLYCLAKGARVISFESDAEIFKVLAKNTKLEKRVKIYNNFVTNNNQGKNITLDKALKKYSKVDILKIDVEGEEYNLIKSTTNSFKKIDRIVIEIHPDKDKQMLEKCKNFGKRIFN